ncbi:unnamed protein product [Phytomonas sp. EM1]|nr:unnamed protein product [Phytomonas sp. EM1]|eukprot:CCW59898.1 unnamed protein product [Phytomonas sp. isolate EM1]
MGTDKLCEDIATLLNANAALQKRITDTLRRVEWELDWVGSLRVSLRKSSGTRKRGRASAASVLQTAMKRFPNNLLLMSAPAKRKKWSLATKRCLLAIADELAVKDEVSVNPALWDEIARRMLRQCGAEWSGIECFQEYARLICDKRDFTAGEDAILHAHITTRPNNWKALSEELHARFGFRRRPFQIAQRCRQLTSKLFYTTHLPVETVWARIEPFVRFPDADCYRIAEMVNSRANARADLPLPPSSVRYAIRYGFFKQQKDRILYWKVMAIFCNFSTPYKELFGSFHSKPYLIYPQISLEDLARHSNSTLEDIRARIVQKLLGGKAGLLNHDFEQLSNELFGHNRVALAIFQEACRLERDAERV